MISVVIKVHCTMQIAKTRDGHAHLHSLINAIMFYSAESIIVIWLFTISQYFTSLCSRGASKRGLGGCTNPLPAPTFSISYENEIIWSQ